MEQVNGGSPPRGNMPPSVSPSGAEALSLGLEEDIPEAQRDQPDPVSSPIRRLGIWLGSATAAMALLGGMTFVVVTGDPGRNQAAGDQDQPLTAIAPALTALLGTYLGPNAAPGGKRPTLLGHRAFDDAPAGDLVNVTADGGVRLRTTAAASFEQMAAAARRDGVVLVPLSGFRSQADQNYLFFGIQEQRGEGPRTRAEVSAPPGYSEHHTGYAIDIGDGDQPDTDVLPEFADTAAFAWLQENAPRYGFELSFPPDNTQGVAYEPWHWRFVGDRSSLETFYQE